MSATNKRRWLTLAVVFALTAVSSFLVFDPDFGVSHHPLLAVLPCIGSLAFLPSDPAAWITPDTRPALTLEALVPAVPPRAPPV